ncbi:hypothetical protein Y032_0179g730 [Ancylostoma ceylanicum]|uniref:Reverse transcriptase domain-containing protein n=1 Tax=Ancylostoma ceylanicum TaxID=53326 RepID=A0A016ST66_9BILA|nr:hypothetical protein Y032_0179g730 [Ancylostoma ceylanicum]
MHDERCGPARIKWWQLKEKEETVTSRIELPPITNIDETWENATRAIVEVARSELGTTKPGRREIGKHAWLWMDEQYLIAKKAAKKVVAATKAAHYGAFDRVSHKVIWYVLRWHGVPEELIERARILYADPRSRVQAAAGRSAELPISVGVHQGSALSPLLFVLVMDAITRGLQRPVTWTLLYADDVMLASEQNEDLERQTQAWSERLARFGLRLNVKKTEYMTTNLDEPSTNQVDSNDLRRTDYFKYLGSTLSADGNLAYEVGARVNAAWLKCCSMTGVLYDKNIPDRFKSKVSSSH